jgi:hypothetical protein
MACAGHCLGAAMASVSRNPHFAPCANAQRCPGVAAGHLVVSLQQVAASLPAAFGSRGAACVGIVWKSRAAGDVFTSGRPFSQRVIVMSNQEASTSTCT